LNAGEQVEEEATGLPTEQEAEEVAELMLAVLYQLLPEVLCRCCWYRRCRNHDGGDTYFDGGVVLAKGGKGGILNNSNGALGGSASESVGTTRYRGGNGANGTAVYSGGGGGGAGNLGNGGDAPDSDLNDGAPGDGTPLYGGSGGTGVMDQSAGDESGYIYGGGGSGAAKSRRWSYKSTEVVVPTESFLFHGLPQYSIHKIQAIRQYCQTGVQTMDTLQVISYPITRLSS
jgi:hypothetical protein